METGTISTVGPVTVSVLDRDAAVATTLNEIRDGKATAKDAMERLQPKIQQVLNERGIAITLNCSDVNGVETMQIASKPDTMSQEEAEQIVFSDEFYTVKGPWSFTFNLGQ